MWIFPTWQYLGFSYSSSHGNDTTHIFMTVIFCAMPSFLMPLFIKRPTMVVYWLLYLLTYIPMVVGVSLSDYFNLGEIYLFNFFALFSFFLTGIGYYFKLLTFKNFLVSHKTFWTWFWVITCIFFGYTIFVFRDNLKVIDLFASNSAELYDFRFSGRDIEAQNPLVGYLILWLSGAFLPFILGYGIVYKKTIFIICGIIGQVILYMTMANKVFILSVIFMWLIYKILKNKIPFGIVFGIVISLFTIIFTLSQNEFSDTFKLIFFPFASLFLVRTIGVSALTSSLYYDFFKINPHTYYSHVGIIGKYINYPYKNEMIGVVIGDHYTAISRYNINANMYITDGIVAVGLIGMPIIGLVSCGVFYLIDSAAKQHNVVFTSLLLSYAGLNIMNVSIFTSIISGGLFLTVIFLFFLKPTKQLG